MIFGGSSQKNNSYILEHNRLRPSLVGTSALIKKVSLNSFSLGISDKLMKWQEA